MVEKVATSAWPDSDAYRLGYESGVYAAADAADRIVARYGDMPLADDLREEVRIAILAVTDRLEQQKDA